MPHQLQPNAGIPPDHWTRGWDGPEPIKVLSRRGENPMPRIEPRFYDCPGLIVMTLLTAVLRIFTTTEKLKKNAIFDVILTVHRR